MRAKILGSLRSSPMIAISWTGLHAQMVDRQLPFMSHIAARTPAIDADYHQLSSLMCIKSKRSERCDAERPFRVERQ